MSEYREDDSQDLLALHVAGATVRHESPFSTLEVIKNTEPLSKEFIGKYVVPFYLGRRDTDEFRENYIGVRESIDGELISKLLGEFNWRSRSVGAYFVAVGGMREFEVVIGNLLLRSDVCYAGHHYCLALASFSSPVAIDYLDQYLEYYLTRQDLWFDQSSAMGALSFIGASKGRDLVTPHMAEWEKFITNKPDWDLASSIERFTEQMTLLNEFRRKTTGSGDQESAITNT